MRPARCRASRLACAGALPAMLLTATASVAAPPVRVAEHVVAGGHARIAFPEPLVPLPAAPDPGPTGRRGAGFVTEDGKLHLEVWEIANAERERLRRPPAAGTVGPGGWKTTYRAGGDGWTVASGFTPRGNVFYGRTDFVCGRRAIAGFVAVYAADPASRARFDPWMGRIRLGGARCDARAASADAAR